MKRRKDLFEELEGISAVGYGIGIGYDISQLNGPIKWDWLFRAATPHRTMHWLKMKKKLKTEFNQLEPTGKTILLFFHFWLFPYYLPQLTGSI